MTSTQHPPLRTQHPMRFTDDIVCAHLPCSVFYAQPIDLHSYSINAISHFIYLMTVSIAQRQAPSNGA